MRIPRPAACLLALALLGPLTSADEIVHFTNGTSLPVKSYKVEQGMLHVTLSDAATMAFPAYLVEKIEGTQRQVAGEGYEANLRSGATRGGQRGSNQAIDFADYQDVEFVEQLPPDINVDPETGLTMYRPFADSAATNQRHTMLPGNTSAMRARMDNSPVADAVRRSGGRTVINRHSRYSKAPVAPRKQKVGLKPLPSSRVDKQVPKN